MILVQHRHLKTSEVNFCNKGARAFFQRHGLDWQAFLGEGIPEEQLIATNDAMAMKVVEQARREWAAAKG